ncbi:hypothetical protein AHAS_Ahas09G0087000 [Arachis hypogaea]
MHLSDKEKEDQLLPPTDSERFANLYCELRFSLSQRRNLNLEKKLAIASDLRRFTEPEFRDRGWSFLDRKLARILVTEADIEEILHYQPKVSDKDAFQRAEEETYSLTFDYDALKSVVAQPDSPLEDGFF